MKKNILGLMLGVALPVTSAHAEVTFNGFANIVAGQASSGDNLWGYDDDISFKPNSLFALQASSDLGEGLSATAQIMSRGENNWDAEFEWAYIGYEVNDNFKVLMGRQRLPLYMYSDFVDVSYAYPWITPPRGVYGIEVNRFDGVSGHYNFTLGQFDSTLSLVYGSSDDSISIGGDDVDSHFENIYGGAVSLNRDWLTLRAAYFTTDLVFPIDGLDQLSQAWKQVPGYTHLGEQIDIRDDNSQFIELAFRVDYENFLLVGEYTGVENDDAPQAEDESTYVTAGYRFDDVLVHLTYGWDETKTNTAFDSLPKGLSPELDQLVAITELTINNLKNDNSFYTLGATWSFHDSASLKVEFSRFDDDLLNQDSSLVRTALVTVF